MPGPQSGEIKRAGTLGIFLLATAIIIGAAWAIFTSHAESLRDDAEDNLRAIAELKKTLIQNYVHERLADATVLAHGKPMQALLQARTTGADRDRARKSLLETLEKTVNAYGYRRIIAFDTTLRPVAPVDTDDNTIAPQAREALSRALTDRTHVLADLHRNKEGQYSFGIAAPVPDPARPDGAPTGVVYLEIDAARRLIPIVTSWKTEKRSAETLLFRPDGNDILFLSPTRLMSDLEPLSMRRTIADNTNLLAVRALTNPSSTIRGAVDYRGQPVIGTSQQIAGTPWLLLSKIDSAEVQSDVTVLGRKIAGLAAIFIIMTGGLAFLARRASQQAAAALKSRLAHRYATAIETSMDAFVRLDNDGRIVETNNALERMTGYSKEELLGLRLEDVEAALSPEQVRVNLQRIREAQTAHFQTRWWKKDGSPIDLDVSVTCPRDQGDLYFYGSMRDITEQLRGERRLKRLNRYYAFMTHVTARIFQLRDAQQILEVFCQAAVDEGGFVLSWAGIVDSPAGLVRVATAAGKGADYARSIVVTTSPELPTSQGPTGVAVRELRSVSINDFLDSPATRPWHDRAREHGIAASAAVPVIVGGKAVAALMFYADTADYFDAEMMALLEETARSVSLSWEAGAMAHERNVERSLRSGITERFERIFDASPLAKQIHATADGNLLAINEAHRRTFGYSMEEIAGTSAWFEKAYPDPAFRTAIRKSWDESITEAARSGATIQSPEIALRCKDGTDRIMRGHMNVAGDVAIVTWVDLTEIRHGEDALRESEQRFRGMVEQTVAGFYIVQEGRIAYANPRFAEMLGRTTTELMGMQSLDLVEAESRARIIDARARLEAGEKMVRFNSHWIRKDGSIVVLGIHSARGLWDGKPAFMVMVDDITERDRTEEKIRDYVARLETAMKGTLQAVAKMVDLRDPYTAGHERRVGLVSAAIAREMGWDENRCRELELIGLVHDIGKIAVPAEVLSKPTRLTQLEYQMIQGHAEAGYEILKDVQFELPVAEIIRQHHERLDGSGYPLGLKGDAIMIEARILAVADVLESMASHRPYRAALGIEAAMAELQRGRGTVYDATVVDTVMLMVREKGYTLPT